MGEGVLEWVEEEGLRQELGGPLGVLRMLLRGYLTAGAKSFTHMITALERYCATLHALLHETGHEVRGPSVRVCSRTSSTIPCSARHSRLGHQRCVSFALFCLMLGTGKIFAEGCRIQSPTRPCHGCRIMAAWNVFSIFPHCVSNES